MSADAPNLFISYSHDTESHKTWVLGLATRLMANGVSVVLDQWDLTFGSDLPRFMETGLSAAQRVLAVCTKDYVAKANDSKGGVGYEKMILSAQLMKNIASDKIIPVIRNNQDAIVPILLPSRVYIDFRNDSEFEIRYGELIRDIHGQKIKPRPQLGQNPFAPSWTPQAPLISFGPERYVSPGMSGTVTFDYSNNNGKYVFGSGDMAFETAWSEGGNSSIYAYDDSPSIRSVALAHGICEIQEILDARIYDNSSRVRSPQLGEIVVWQNTAGYYAATKIERIQCRSRGAANDELTFSYVISPNKSSSFTRLPAAYKSGRR